MFSVLLRYSFRSLTLPFYDTVQKQNRKLQVALAQLNLCVGDLGGNVRQSIAAIQQAKTAGADVILFPELTLSSYPPEDLVFRGDFLGQVMESLCEIRMASDGITVIVGYPVVTGGTLRNAACVYRDGVMLGQYFKRELPNYTVYDEERWFVAGDADQSLLVDIKGVRCGILICEDIWHDAPIDHTVGQGAEAVFVLNASPYRHDKHARREQMVTQKARRHQCPVAYTNMVGGQDELVFDGDSMLVNRDGERTLAAPLFEPGLFVGEMQIDADNLGDEQAAISAAKQVTTARDQNVNAHIYQAIVTGLRDYVHKNGFKGILLGLSGGIDSGLTLAVAVDALGAENVEAVMMPFRYTADMSVEDAAEQAKMLGVTYRNIPIEPMYESFKLGLSGAFSGFEDDVTEENLQARIRGMLLMSMSNKFGKLLLSTSNKSESAVGYATLYGDMAGAFAPLKDVYKTLVYTLSEYRNTLSPAIPQRVIDRPPSAELAPGQLDQDSLPDYDVLDAILTRVMEDNESLESIVAAGFDATVVKRVVNLLLLSEYKRRQAAPGVRITRRAFGKDWRYPITSAWRHQLPL
ncbi:MAG: NAD synthetase (EC / Glutamine amidotransferase chain of NAD synthetase [uncultured Thiotrichaceae bacterium]|uniref:Glutamine-dependent NAD(+) synthetase n=1 Tax=uncultured Thiotrichaceae bacterium TaxID=298394 RepID=A0A6S6SXF5_9GAMM|nr:MAG: NAD synthetase (EC / Glutamine amidotransferase chain of NAD synthetase [uncultured Thiotrichaceae bacterium]